uniref:Putative secreted protein n=1 Tax=Anopheles marajoara TaxID=58244 RepID=A0A2M4C8U8_9DIPT
MCLFCFIVVLLEANNFTDTGAGNRFCLVVRKKRLLGSSCDLVFDTIVCFCGPFLFSPTGRVFLFKFAFFFRSPTVRCSTSTIPLLFARNGCKRQLLGISD